LKTMDIYGYAHNPIAESVIFFSLHFPIPALPPWEYNQSMTAAFDLISFGRSTLDILQLVDHFPTGDEIIRVKASSIQGGGPVATAACAAACLGVSTAIIDRIGDDWRAGLIRDGFTKAGVSTDLLQKADDCSSSQSVILVRSGSGERSILVVHGTAPEPDLTEESLHAIRKCRVLHVAESYPELTLKAIAAIKEAGGLVSFDGGSGLFKDSDLEIISQADWVITALGFARQLTGKTEIPDILKALKQRGAAIVGVTGGASGSWFLDEAGQVFHQPAFHIRQVIDTTGCGDVFHGAFIAGMLKTGSLTRAVEIASAAGALTAAVLGGQEGLPSEQQVSELIESLRKPDDNIMDSVESSV
jgi:sulfofructose kinase